jgi:hypothetical protein
MAPPMPKDERQVQSIAPFFIINTLTASGSVRAAWSIAGALVEKVERG